MRFSLALTTIQTTVVRVGDEPVVKVHTRGRIPVDLELGRPRRWLVLGVAGTGKSSLLETLAYVMKLMDRDAVVVDIFGSVAGEGLAWLRSPLAPGSRFTLVTPEDTVIEMERINGNGPIVQGIPHTMFDAGVLGESDFVIVSTPIFHGDFEEEFEAILRVLDVAYKTWSLERRVIVLMREASEILAPRKRRATVPQRLYNNIITITREARHRNITLLLDTYKFTSIDVDYRTLADFIAVKRTGLYELPSPLDRIVYRYFAREKIQNLPPDTFILLTSRGQVGVGWFRYPEWHKREDENILRELGLNTIRTAPPEENG